MARKIRTMAYFKHTMRERLAHTTHADIDREMRSIRRDMERCKAAMLVGARKDRKRAAAGLAVTASLLGILRAAKNHYAAG